MAIARSLRFLAVGASLALFGCGSDETNLPDGVVAQVGDQTITWAALDHATVGRKVIGRTTPGAPAFWPADVKGCVRTLSARQSASGVPRDVIRQRCERLRERERAAALRVLIQGEWYVREARKRKLDVRVPKDGLVATSREAGVEPADLADVARAYLLRPQLVPEVLSQSPRFSAATVARYFEAHRDRYVEEPQRFVDALVVPARGTALRVAAQMRRGRHSSTLVEQFASEGAIDPFGGGSLSVAAEGRPSLQRATRALEEGAVSMVEDPRGWFVFRVTGVMRRIEPTLARSRDRVVQDLEVRHIERTYATYNERLQSRYGDETVCVDGFDVPECG